MNAAQRANQHSGKQDWMTPMPIVEAARATMGAIDLDPASSAQANRRIGATDYYTVSDNGLAARWWGRVWLNWPYGPRENQLWPAKLLAEYESGHVKQACTISYAATSEAWFQPFYQFPICFLAGRTQFIDPLTEAPAEAPTKGCCVVYLGPHGDRFIGEFSRLGHVMITFVEVGDASRR
jgi:ParB family chromosome partitioning protein